MTDHPDSQSIAQAEVTWSDGQPVSTRFDDVYYSKDNGLMESRHVFIDGNNLAERWGRLNTGDTFTIAETGFGTGLNFLNAADLWLKAAPESCRLNYVSLEKYPLSCAALKQALGHWPQLSELVPELINSYPVTVGGVHRRWLFNDRVCLTLVFDDAVEGLQSLQASDHPAYTRIGNSPIDAWFLDGFAPAKNPQLWSPPLFNAMACFSGASTTLATFTVARAVRDGLTDAGFGLRKTPGFGRKREMLQGRFQGPEPELPAAEQPAVLRNSVYEAPWYLHLQPQKTQREAIIIGAGIAGSATAGALTRRGWRVTVIDRHGTPGAEASGNPQGILYPRLSVEDSALSLFGLHALCHAQNIYRRYWDSGKTGAPCGVLVVPENPREEQQFDKILARFNHAKTLVTGVSGNELKDISGISLRATKGLYFPNLGWVCPPLACDWLLGGAQIVRAECDHLEWDASGRRWEVFDGQGKVIANAPIVIVANSHRASQFSQTRHLPLRRVRGQISTVSAGNQSSGLSSVICGSGYLAPAWNGVHTLGATYDVDNGCTEVRSEDHARNIHTLEMTDANLPELFDAGALTPRKMNGRAGIRCITPDYLPIAGPAPDQALMAERFAGLRRNARAEIPLPGAYIPGLWLNCGHGSRGLTYAPMAAEMLAGQINGEILPLSRSLAMAINPARFTIRNLKRNLL